jgi:hypothetical protein
MPNAATYDIPHFDPSAANLALARLTDEEIAQRQALRDPAKR